MRRPLPFGGTPFRVSADGAPGVSRSRTRATDLISPFYGVRMSAASQGLRSLCEAYATTMAPDQYFSHHTAATLLGLPIDRTTELHVTSIAPRREPRARGVIGHRVAAGRDRLVEIGGLLVSSPVDTWVALAEYLSLEELIVVGDGLVRRWDPMATMTDLERAVAGSGGRRGCRLLAEALRQVRPRTDSARETHVRRWLVKAGLPEPVVNFAITNERGVFLGFGDLSFPDYRVLAEYDGGHHFTAYQSQRDINRLESFMAAEWRVVRFNKTHSRAESVRLVRAALVQRGWSP